MPKQKIPQPRQQTRHELLEIVQRMDYELRNCRSACEQAEERREHFEHRCGELEREARRMFTERNDALREVERLEAEVMRWRRALHVLSEPCIGREVVTGRSTPPR